MCVLLLRPIFLVIQCALFDGTSVNARAGGHHMALVVNHRVSCVQISLACTLCAIRLIRAGCNESEWRMLAASKWCVLCDLDGDKNSSLHAPCVALDRSSSSSPPPISLSVSVHRQEGCKGKPSLSWRTWVDSCPAGHLCCAAMHESRRWFDSGPLCPRVPRESGCQLCGGICVMCAFGQCMPRSGADSVPLCPRVP